MRCRALLLVLALLVPASASGQRVRLTVRSSGRIVALDADSLRSSYRSGDQRLMSSIAWREVRPGLSWASLDLAAGALQTPVRAVTLRLDPRRFRLGLEWKTAQNGMTGAWTVDSLGAEVALGLNAGQFKETGPWGWVVIDGEERRDPGVGPASVGIAVTDSGTIRWIPAERLHASRGDPSVVSAFQTYPLLLLDGAVPPLVRDPGLVDQDHRDARLILGELADGDLVVVLTRFDGLGALAERVPIGLTLPESVALAAALGARHAAMLDGGISAQMAVRGPGGTPTSWRGLRPVPLALIATPR